MGLLYREEVLPRLQRDLQVTGQNSMENRLYYLHCWKTFCYLLIATPQIHKQVKLLEHSQSTVYLTALKFISRTMHMDVLITDLPLCKVTKY